jgi:nitroimidazol reductase NimA-like FMN-containing flavoprotein (pyridoxamine 5'-phosphate oxidase superfamily)
MSKLSFDPSQRPPEQQRRNRQHKVQSDEWVRAFLHRAQICTIATAWEDIPFTNTTLFWYDEAGGRIIFHSNVMGRVRANIEHNPKVCLTCFEPGNLLPSNAAVEFSIQYRSVVVFGEAQVIEDQAEAAAVLDRLIAKYFPHMHPGQEYRPIQTAELNHTSVYAIRISSWSGKESFAETAMQIDTWPALPEDQLKGFPASY